MCKVFISGSMRIKKLDENILKRINNIIHSQYEIIVGDASGVDSSIQQHLLNNEFNMVRVYCSGARARNNLGSWKTKNIYSNEKAGTRAFFTAKDLEMAKDCDYGFMIWDTKSTGTLSNAIELLKKEKTSLVYVNKERKFITVKNVTDLEELVSYMNEASFMQANKKLGLKTKIDSFKYKQQSIFEQSTQVIPT